MYIWRKKCGFFYRCEFLSIIVFLKWQPLPTFLTQYSENLYIYFLNCNTQVFIFRSIVKDIHTF